MDFNKKRTGIEQKFFELTSTIVSDNGYVLYDMEYVAGSSTLRVFIMDPETQSAIIEDCVKVDRAFTPYCEDEAYNWIPDDFMLEVSSPGMYRSLKTMAHFESALSKTISINLIGKLNEEQAANLSTKLKKANKFRGELKAVNEKEIQINIDSVDVHVGFEQIKRANLDPDF